jgi:hypothetical protein
MLHSRFGSKEDSMLTFPITIRSGEWEDASAHIEGGFASFLRAMGMHVEVSEAETGLYITIKDQYAAFMADLNLRYDSEVYPCEYGFRPFTISNFADLSMYIGRQLEKFGCSSVMVHTAPDGMSNVNVTLVDAKGRPRTIIFAYQQD